MRKHHELKAWQEAMELVKEIYRVTHDMTRKVLRNLRRTGDVECLGRGAGRTLEKKG